MTTTETYASRAGARRAALKMQLNPADWSIETDAAGRFVINLAAPVTPAANNAVPTSIETPKSKKGKGKATPSKDAPVAPTVDVDALKAKLAALLVDVASVKAELKAAGKGTGTRGPVVAGAVKLVWSYCWAHKKTVTRKDVIAYCASAGIPANTGSTQYFKYTKSNDAERKARAGA